MQRRSLFLVAALLFACAFAAFGQGIFTHHAQFRNAQQHEVFTLLGEVDFENSSVNLPWPKAFRARENMHSIVIENIGLSPVLNPWLRINDKRFIFEDADVGAVVLGSRDFYDSALQIWKFFSENTNHRYFPFDGYRVGSPVELLTYYGHGICFNQANAIATLAMNDNKHFFDLLSQKHSVGEFRRGRNAALIDTDLKTFYLEYNGSGIASRKTAAMDRHLIRRTHHYGKQYTYDEYVNDYISQVYYANNTESNITKEPAVLEYTLDPGAKMIFDYSAPTYYVGPGRFNGDADELANGRFQFGTQNSAPDYYTQRPGALENLTMAIDNRTKSFKRIDLSRNASLNFSVNSGFPVVYTKVYADLNKATISHLTASVSSDSISWQTPTEVSIEGNRITFGLVTNQTPLMDKVYVRLNLEEDSGDLAITDFGYQIYFQVNRYMLPRPRIGQNTMHFSTGTTVPFMLQTTLTYESLSGTVLSAPTESVFPADAQVIYGRLDSISWKPVSGAIPINYEFELTDDSVSQLPVSPGFNTYTITTSYASSVQWTVPGAARAQREPPAPIGLNPAAYIAKKYGPKGVASARKRSQLVNTFDVPHDGLLVSDRPYFWRVRSLSADSTWGEWSRYFSFTIRKVMPPTDLQVIGNAGADRLIWKWPTTGVAPVAFEIYGSNEYLGFELSSASLIATTNGTSFNVSDQPFAFFRVIGVDSLGNKSELSEYVSRAYPYLNAFANNVFADSLFRMPLVTTPIYSSYANIDDGYEEYVDKVKISVRSFPSWLKMDYPTKSLVGSIDEERLKRDFYAGLNKVDLEFDSEFSNVNVKTSIGLHYIVHNRKPKLSSVDTTVFDNNEFRFSIPYSDADRIYGDSVFFEIENRPKWLQLNIEEDQIVLHGTMAGDIGTHNIRFLAYDKYGDTTRTTFHIKVISNVLSYVAYPGTRNFASFTIEDEWLRTLLATGQLSLDVPPTLSEPFSTEIDETLNVTLHGDFCLPNGFVQYYQAIVAHTINGKEVHFLLDVRVNGFTHPTPYTAYHVADENSIHVLNNACSDMRLTFVIIDQTGRLVDQREATLLSGETGTFNLRPLSSGIYIAAFWSGDKRISFRFFKG
jgi:hypothetical protein